MTEMKTIVELDLLVAFLMKSSSKITWDCLQAEAVCRYLRGEVEQKDAKFKAALDNIKGLLGLVDYRDVVIEKLRGEVEQLEAQVIELAPVNFRCVDCGHEYAHFHTENSTGGDDCNFVDLSEDLE